MDVYAGTDPSAQRNGTPERQMLCKIAESFLASAILAFPAPPRLAIASAQSLSGDDRLTR